MNGLDEPYIFHDITLKTSKLKFKYLDFDENTKKSDIKIFLKNTTLQCNTKTLKQALFIIIQNLSGEKSLCQNINFVQLEKTANNDEELICLYDLQLYIDEINKNPTNK
jgi:hypothetical protein